MAEQSELTIQGLFRSRARIRCPAVHIVAVPNGGKRGQKALNQAMREGMALGFPDVIALAPGKVAFLEFKSAKGRVSDNQTDWLDRLHGMGFPCGIFRDADKAIDFLREHDFPFIDGARPIGAIIEPILSDILANLRLDA